jgi:hypothetical protein
MLDLKRPVLNPVMINAMRNAAIEFLLSSIIPGTAERMRMMWPTRAMATATQIVLNRPRYVSAIHAPTSRVM